MKKKEANFAIQFDHWLMAKPRGLISAPIEKKDTRGSESFPFSELKEDQINRLLACGTDTGHIMRTLGATGVPDSCYYRNAPGYVAIKYPKEFFIITIGTYDMERRRSKRKSLTRDRAREICIKSVRCK